MPIVTSLGRKWKKSLRYEQRLTRAKREWHCAHCGTTAITGDSAYEQHVASKHPVIPTPPQKQQDAA
jgi:hypothetical protein